MDRLQAERQFHDQQARSRRADLNRTGLTFSDDDYLDHEPWIRPAFAALGQVRGRRVLDFGCGHGMAAVVLARLGAVVTAFDLSGEYLREAHDRASANKVKIDCVQANGERLPFADETFDAIWGNAVLHHLDMGRAAGELHRILKPGGVAVFCEPWGENPLLNWARRFWPYRGKERTRDEEPLKNAQLQVLQGPFRDSKVRGYQLFGMARRVLGAGPLTSYLEQWDRSILGWVPSLQKLCRYMVIILRKSDHFVLALCAEARNDK